MALSLLCGCCRAVHGARARRRTYAPPEDATPDSGGAGGTEQGKGRMGQGREGKGRDGTRREGREWRAGDGVKGREMLAWKTKTYEMYRIVWKVTELARLSTRSIIDGPSAGCALAPAGSSMRLPRGLKRAIFLRVFSREAMALLAASETKRDLAAGGLTIVAAACCAAACCLRAMPGLSF